MADRPRFHVDEMLGTLAKWLRIMGYDTVYDRDRTDGEIAASAEREGRALLTRDKMLARKVGGSGLYIVSDVLEEQVAQVVGVYGLEFDEGLTRCAVCNGVLVRISMAEAEKEAPEGSLRMTDEFFRCPGCAKVYWKGTHWKSIVGRMEDFGL
jgi:uncharacterized protein with PIN domain